MENVQTVILPIILLAIVIAVSTYLYTKDDSFQGYQTYEGYTSNIRSGPGSGSGSSAGPGSRAGSGSATGSNVPSNSSNIRSNNSSNNSSNDTSVYGIFSNILSKYGDKIADSTTADFKLDVKYDGHEYENKGKRKHWPYYTSDEHEDADEIHDTHSKRREIKSFIHNELLNNLGRTTGNRLYFNDEDEDDDRNISIARQQGLEHTRAKKDRNCGPNAMDMNQYIRKDSIPCWGCDIE
jgi:hypothetical protein